MAALAVFIVLLMFATAVKTENGGATFWKKEVTLTCPEAGDWYEDQKAIGQKGQEITFQYERAVNYKCKYSEDEYDFYIKGRACENCFELDGKFFLVFIIVDLIGTALLMMMIYRCSKKKGPDGPAPPNKTPSKTGIRNHTPQETHYEPLNPNTRSTGTYSTVNRTG